MISSLVMPFAMRFAEAMTLAMLSDSLVMPSMSSVSPLFSLVMISSEIFFAANISELTRAADEEFCSRRRASQFSSLAHLLTVASVSPVSRRLPAAFRRSETDGTHNPGERRALASSSAFWSF